MEYTPVEQKRHKKHKNDQWRLLKSSSKGVLKCENTKNVSKIALGDPSNLRVHYTSIHTQCECSVSCSSTSTNAKCSVERVILSVSLEYFYCIYLHKKVLVLYCKYNY